MAANRSSRPQRSTSDHASEGGTKLGSRAPRGATRRKILTTLKKSDGLTADQLAGLLGITAMAVRKHLTALERDGLVESTAVRRAVGRPAHVYRLSSLADDFFPKQYDLVITDAPLPPHVNVNTDFPSRKTVLYRIEPTRKQRGQQIVLDMVEPT